MSIKRNAFTMIELIFVIVILGVLASIAIPKLAATRDDAIVAKGRANVLAIRSGIIAERQARMFRGNSLFVASLGDATDLFSAVLAQSVKAKAANVSGGWRKNGGEVYIYHAMGQDATFTYSGGVGGDGTFTCAAGTLCSLLTD